MNIAIFSGSFKPFHSGHKAIIKQALSVLNIKKLIIVPNFYSPFKKKSRQNPKEQYKIIKNTYKKNKHIYVCDYEILKKRKSYSINTILYIKSKYANIKNMYFIIGADNIAKLHRWKRYRGDNGIKNNIKLVVASRCGSDIRARNIKIHKILDVDEPISSSDIRANSRY